jgi:hypothetical protein
MSLERRIKALELMSGVDEPCYDIVMIAGGTGGLFGHSHFIVSSDKTVTKPCSEEEELEIMLSQYEKDEQRVWGKGERVSFAEYLEYFEYLGPDELKDSRREVIEALRAEMCEAHPSIELKRLIRKVIVVSKE